MDYDPDEFSFEDRYDDDDVHYRTCGRCGARTQPRWSESACLEEARRYGWRRVAASDRPGARRMIRLVTGDDAQASMRSTLPSSATAAPATRALRPSGPGVPRLTHPSSCSSGVQPNRARTAGDPSTPALFHTAP